MPSLLLRLRRRVPSALPSGCKSRPPAGGERWIVRRSGRLARYGWHTSAQEGRLKRFRQIAV
jgi:hypothetical protein